MFSGCNAELHDMDGLTERQFRELEYHKTHAREHYERLKNISFDVLDRSETRWWNAYWEMYRYLRSADLKGRRVLVVGCGAGRDAILLAKLEAEVYAFDLSPDLLAIGSEIAQQLGLQINFRQAPAEMLPYPPAFFDLILMVDILHHCEVEQVLRELRRVSKEYAVWVVNEIYTHSFLQKLRKSSLIDRWVYPRITRIIYPGKPYITEDERKLDEVAFRSLKQFMRAGDIRFFGAFVQRIFPAIPAIAKIDRALLVALKPVAAFLGGRLLMVGTGIKYADEPRMQSTASAYLSVDQER